MKVDISNKDPYTAVAEIVFEKMGNSQEKFPFLDNCIVRIRTTNLGTSNEFLMLGQGGSDWEWLNDWYEGGEVEILGCVRLSELDIKNDPNNLLKEE